MKRQRFKLNISVETDDENIKDKCCEAVSEVLKDTEYFDVNYVADNWKARLVNEHEELKEKLAKLMGFMSSEKFFTLSENYKTVLQNQKMAMEMYLQALNCRLYEDLDNNTKQVPNMSVMSMIAGMFSNPWCGYNCHTSEKNNTDTEQEFKTTGVNEMKFKPES